jgi:hypothetical protein
MRTITRIAVVVLALAGLVIGSFVLNEPVVQAQAECSCNWIGDCAEGEHCQGQPCRTVDGCGFTCYWGVCYPD